MLIFHSTIKWQLNQDLDHCKSYFFPKKPSNLRCTEIDHGRGVCMLPCWAFLLTFTKTLLIIPCSQLLSRNWTIVSAQVRRITSIRKEKIGKNNRDFT